MLYSDIGHDCLWRVSKHLCYIKVERLYTVTLNKAKVSISCGMSHHVHGRTLSFCNLFHVVKMLFINEQSHAFLAFIGNNFFGT